jgi:MFS transporter, PAT family, beta-lactamase induction signal transducer AmpG
MKPHRVHPSLFMVLILPFGMMAGYLTVAVAYLFARAGISVGEIAGVVALGIAPHTWKFAWAPIADTTLSRKTWYVIACVVSAIGIWATGALPIERSSVGLLSAIVLISNVAVTFLGMSVESLMAYDTPDDEKGRAGGWFQAGNLGGSGIGGGAGLWLAQHLHAPWMAGAILGGVSLLCCLALLAVEEPAATHRVRGVAGSLANVARDLWGVARSRMGILALILCFLPIGSGAASGLWSAVASDWHASANAVALATGVLGGVISAIGCLIGGFVCDRMDRKAAYAVFGVLQAACAVAMALAPRTESTYVVFTSLYALIMGLTYAGFSAFVLEAMGMGAAATKYNVFASLSNTPIYYMTRIDGWAHTRWGPSGMLFGEAAFGVVGLLVFTVVVAAMPKSRAAGDPAPVFAAEEI